jgi:hypothetical protein
LFKRLIEDHNMELEKELIDADVEMIVDEYEREFTGS